MGACKPCKLRRLGLTRDGCDVEALVPLLHDPLLGQEGPCRHLVHLHSTAGHSVGTASSQLRTDIITEPAGYVTEGCGALASSCLLPSVLQYLPGSSAAPQPFQGPITLKALLPSNPAF